MRAAIAGFYARRYGAALDPETEVCVTTSGTEALYAAVQAFVDPGDEVIVLQPGFPW